VVREKGAVAVAAPLLPDDNRPEEKVKETGAEVIGRLDGIGDPVPDPEAETGTETGNGDAVSPLLVCEDKDRDRELGLLSLGGTLVLPGKETGTLAVMAPVSPVVTSVVSLGNTVCVRGMLEDVIVGVVASDTEATEEWTAVP